MPVIKRNDTDGQRFAGGQGSVARARERPAIHRVRSRAKDREVSRRLLKVNGRHARSIAHGERKRGEARHLCARFIGIFAAAVSLLSARLTTPPPPVSPTSFSRCREIVSAMLHPLYPREKSRRNDPFRSDEWIDRPFHARENAGMWRPAEISVAK